ncbi:hypothetical protein B0J12DRAFT_144660 [Macrophomina phaseolina]|uniref:Uncharacterized protein n=1 Tax=Macrophomina phaseolina TaxID=35725 RepID=A0ABQ8G600_9PEZI|nr:hypothetical protein B0J12DRAFT_144660 [Macrophomina phaseolina]
MNPNMRPMHPRNATSSETRPNKTSNQNTQKPAASLPGLSSVHPAVRIRLRKGPESTKSTNVLLPMMQRAIGVARELDEHACTEATNRLYMQAAEDPLDKGDENEKPKNAKDDRKCRPAPRNTRMRIASCWYGIPLLPSLNASASVRLAEGRNFPCVTYAFVSRRWDKKRGEGWSCRTVSQWTRSADAFPAPNQISQTNAMTSCLQRLCPRP